MMSLSNGIIKIEIEKINGS